MKLKQRMKPKAFVKKYWRLFLGGLIIAGVVFCAIFAPLLTDCDPEFVDILNAKAMPSAEHPVGTDTLGRDVWARILYGSRSTLIVAVGALLITPLEPILRHEALTPAFDNILPALFGALGVVYISKNWKIAIAPIAVMLVLFIAIPSLGGSVGIMVPVGAIIAVAVARVRYKNGKI